MTPSPNPDDPDGDGIVWRNGMPYSVTCGPAGDACGPVQLHDPGSHHDAPNWPLIIPLIILAGTLLIAVALALLAALTVTFRRHLTRRAHRGLHPAEEAARERARAWATR